MKPINLRIAEELGVREQQVAAAISLLDGGATVPFVARYRKEATGALDDVQLRTLDERLRYLRELDAIDRRNRAYPGLPQRDSDFWVAVRGDKVPGTFGLERATDDAMELWRINKRTPRR
jgi:hypothetical protein